MKQIMEIEDISPLPLSSLNHISLLCTSVKNSAKFYEEIMGFVLIKRPSSFNFHGAWLFNYGVGIHLLQRSSMEVNASLRGLRPINPKDNHISFICTDIGLVQKRLKEMEIKYVTAVVEDGGIRVDQVFFHDPDGYMIEICDCQNIPVLPLGTMSSTSFLVEPKPCDCMKAAREFGVVETDLIDRLSMDMINISF